MKPVFFASIILSLSISTECARAGGEISASDRAYMANMGVSAEALIKRVGTDAAIRSMKAQVANTTKDPDSARFRNIRFGRYNGNRVLCGMINVKNTYGGYTGYKNFAAGNGYVKVFYSPTPYDAMTFLALLDDAVSNSNAIQSACF